MLGTGDQVILQVRGKIYKVLFRILLGGNERIPVDNVELYVPDLQVTESADKRYQFLCALVAFQAFGCEFDVEHAGGPVTHGVVFSTVVGQ